MAQTIRMNGVHREFRRVFEEKKGKSWMEMRRAFAFNGKFIIPTLASLCSILSSPTLYFITAVKGLHYLRGLL